MIISSFHFMELLYQSYSTFPPLPKENFWGYEEVFSHSAGEITTSYHRRRTHHNISAVQFRQFLEMFVRAGKVAVCQLQQPSAQHR